MKNDLNPSVYRRAIETLEARIAPAALIGLDDSNHLLTFDSASPGTVTATVVVSGLGAGETLIGIDVRPATGALYGVTIDASNAARVYVINPATGAATLSATLAADPADLTSPFTALDGTSFGVDFNPVADRLRIVSDNEQNLRVNVDSGLVTTDAPLAPPGTVAGAAYTNNFTGAASTVLYDIDVTSDTLAIQNPPNNGTLVLVGPLGVNATGVAGFEIVSTRAANGAVTDTAFAALTVGGTTGLYSINLATGAATSIGAVSAGSTALAGLTSAPSAPSARAFTVDTNSHLLSFNTATPNNTTDVGAITGLGGGETVIGFDFRPASGELVLVTKDAGNGGHLYTLDTATAVATSLGTLTADAADTTSPFTALSGTSFGVDFNPVVDRLRIVSDSGQNLRVNVSTALVTTDGDLNGVAGASVLGAAYTNDFAGAASTALYDIDFASDKLLLQSSPNNGTLAVVGSLGVDAQAVGGFDIRSNNEAYATLAVGGVTSLYRINLSTGAANVVGQLGAGTGTLGLALVPNGTLQFSATAISVGEDDGNATLTINRIGGSDGTVSVVVDTADGTASAPGDYTTVSRVITFGPGVTSQQILVPIIDDALQEPSENFTVALSDAAGGAALNAQLAATVTILDNDTPLTLTIDDVAKAEGNAGTTTFNFTVHLNAATASDITVDYATSNDTATAGSDYLSATGTLTIPSGQTSGVISVTVNGDTAPEPDETFTVTLSNPSAATIGDSTATGKILNDDANIGNGKVITFFDVDGDLVTIKVTKGTLDSSNLVFEPRGTVGGQQLLTLDLSDSEFAKANVFATAKRTTLGGDGYVNAGFLDATGVDLGVVQIDGDLGQIDAGAVTKLSVHSLGLFGLSTQALAGSLVSNLTGKLGNLAVQTNIDQATLIVAGDIGPVKIGGSIVGGATDHSGSIEATGRIASMNVFGSLIGGSGAQSGSIIAKTAGPIKIRGDLDGGSILISGNPSPVNARAAVALTSLSVSGNVDDANILIGYDRDALPVNADVSTGAISVTGFARASNIAAGVKAGTDGLFGTADDQLIAAANGIIARIASISIKGQVLGTTDDAADHFGFVAEQIGAFKTGRAKLPFATATTEVFELGVTGDVTVREVIA